MRASRDLRPIAYLKRGKLARGTNWHSPTKPSRRWKNAARLEKSCGGFLQFRKNCPTRTINRKGANAPLMSLPVAPATMPAAVPTPRPAIKPWHAVKAVRTVIVGPPPAMSPRIAHPPHLNGGAREGVGMRQSIWHCGGRPRRKCGGACQRDQADESSSHFHAHLQFWTYMKTFQNL